MPARGLPLRGLARAARQSPAHDRQGAFPPEAHRGRRSDWRFDRGTLVQLEYPCVQYRPLVQRGAQRPVHAILQVELPPPSDDMGEQVSVERRVLRQDLVQIEHVLRGDELIEPDGPGGYRGPFARTPRMIGIGPSLSDLLEDHRVESRSAEPGSLTRIPERVLRQPAGPAARPRSPAPDSRDMASSQPDAGNWPPGLRKLRKLTTGAAISQADNRDAATARGFAIGWPFLARHLATGPSQQVANPHVIISREQLPARPVRARSRCTDSGDDLSGRNRINRHR